jgi:hypothetical protein
MANYQDEYINLRIPYEGSDSPIAQYAKRQKPLSGPYLPLKFMPNIIQKIVKEYDGLVLIREIASGRRTQGTMWNKGRVLAFTVEDPVRTKKIFKQTAIPGTLAINQDNDLTVDEKGIYTINPKDPGAYNITFDNGSNDSGNMQQNWAKFPEDPNPVMQAGVLPRVGNDLTAMNIKTIKGFDGGFDGIRIHAGANESWTDGCIIVSRVRYSSGEMLIDFEGSRSLSRFIYYNGLFSGQANERGGKYIKKYKNIPYETNRGIRPGQDDKNIVIINLWEFPPDPSVEELKQFVINEETGEYITGAEILYDKKLLERARFQYYEEKMTGSLTPLEPELLEPTVPLEFNPNPPPMYEGEKGKILQNLTIPPESQQILEFSGYRIEPEITYTVIPLKGNQKTFKSYTKSLRYLDKQYEQNL